MTFFRRGRGVNSSILHDFKTYQIPLKAFVIGDSRYTLPLIGSNSKVHYHTSIPMGFQSSLKQSVKCGCANSVLAPVVTWRGRAKKTAGVVPRQVFDTSRSHICD